MPWEDKFNSEAGGGTVRPRNGPPADTGCYHEKRDLEVMYVKVRESYVAKQTCVRCGDVKRTVLETDDEEVEELDDEEVIERFGLDPNISFDELEEDKDEDEDDDSEGPNIIWK